MWNNEESDFCNNFADSLFFRIFVFQIFGEEEFV